MDVTFEQTRPHVTMTLFRCDKSGLLADEVVARLDPLAETLTIAPTHPFDADRFVVPLPPRDEEGLSARGAWYSIRKPPPWFHVRETPALNEEPENEGGEKQQGNPPATADEL